MVDPPSAEEIEMDGIVVVAQKEDLAGTLSTESDQKWIQRPRLTCLISAALRGVFLGPVTFML